MVEGLHIHFVFEEVCHPWRERAPHARMAGTRLSKLAVTAASEWSCENELAIFLCAAMPMNVRATENERLVLAKCYRYTPLSEELKRQAPIHATFRR